MNVVIYARFSSHSQTEQSIEGQLRVCYEYANAHNYTVIGEYIDRAQSGTSDNRQDFQRMIQDSEKKTFQFVLVYQLDRFARNRYDSAIHKAKLKKNGVRVLSAKENITDDASGILIEGVLESMAEYYSVELAQKINRGMQLNAEKCLSNGSNPGLGYRVNKNRQFYIDKKEAAIVREIFERYASGEIVADIINDLNDRNIRTSRGNEFNKNSISRILHNKRYIGYYLYKGKETPGGMPRIIDDELFYRVQHLLEKNKAAPGHTHGKGEYLLTTKLYCGHCYAQMTGYSGTSKCRKVYHYYICNNTKIKKCKSKIVAKDLLENTVIDACVHFLNSEKMEIIAEMIFQSCQDDINVASIKRLTLALRETEGAIENLWNALEHGQNPDIITNRIKSRESEKAQIEKQLAIEKSKIQSYDYPRILSFLERMKGHNNNTFADRKTLAHAFIHSVYHHNDYLIIILNGGKGLVTEENIPLKSIENAFFSDVDQTFSSSPVSMPVPPELLESKLSWARVSFCPSCSDRFASSTFICNFTAILP